MFFAGLLAHATELAQNKLPADSYKLKQRRSLDQHAVTHFCATVATLATLACACAAARQFPATGSHSKLHLCLCASTSTLAPPVFMRARRRDRLGSSPGETTLRTRLGHHPHNLHCKCQRYMTAAAQRKNLPVSLYQIYMQLTLLDCDRFQHLLLTCTRQL